jgi:hypothetical protein
MKEEVGSRHNDRRFGEYPALVEAIAAVGEHLRPKVRVLGVFSDEVPVGDLPAAEFRLSVGARANAGLYMPVEVGDWVWVDFPYAGDTRRPRITGGMQFAPDDDLYLPHEAWGGAGQHAHLRAGAEPAGPVHAPGEDGILTLNGVTVEFNKEGSVSIIHRATGTEITIDKDGKLVLHGGEAVFVSSLKKMILLAMETIELDGGSGSPLGVVQGGCLCAFTGAPHGMVSTNVKASL